jgi:hypothetical protein
MVRMRRRRKAEMLQRAMARILLFLLQEIPHLSKDELRT